MSSIESNALAGIPIGIKELSEPFPQELERVRYEELQNEKAIRFAFSLEAFEGLNEPDYNLEASHYYPVYKEDTPFYTRFTTRPNSPSLGLVMTDIERANIEIDEKGDPVLYTFGPNRRRLAIAQRVEFFLQHQSEEVYEKIKDILSGKEQIPERPNRKHGAVEKALTMTDGVALSTAAYTDLGYKKRSSKKELSRSEIAINGLFNRDGRRVIGVGSLPPASGWRDVVVTAALGHMPVFIPRNNLFAEPKRRIELIKAAQKVIKNLVPEEYQDLIIRNIGVAIGTGDPKKELEIMKRIHEETGTKLYRIYTINADPRTAETAYLAREYFGDQLELWVGQIADLDQVKEISETISGLPIANTAVWGHAAGRLCTSAKNGMAITMVEDIYLAAQNPNLNKINFAVEGGVGTLVGIPLLLGADYVLYNQQLVHGTIEAGDLLVKLKSGKMAQIYPGSASPTTQIIESSFEELRKTRTASAGRTTNPEGKPGFMYYERKANSMVFWVREFLGYAARMLADLGVKNFKEMRELLAKEPREEILRIINHSTAKLAEAYRET